MIHGSRSLTIIVLRLVWIFPGNTTEDNLAAIFEELAFLPLVDADFDEIDLGRGKGSISRQVRHQ